MLRQEFLGPKEVDVAELEYLVNHIKRPSEANELIKFSIMMNRCYIIDVQRKIPRFLSKEISFLDKQSRRKALLEETNKNNRNDYQKFSKQLNPELISKEKLEKDMIQRWTQNDKLL